MLSGVPSPAPSGDMGTSGALRLAPLSAALTVRVAAVAGGLVCGVTAPAVEVLVTFRAPRSGRASANVADGSPHGTPAAAWPVDAGSVAVHV